MLKIEHIITKLSEFIPEPCENIIEELESVFENEILIYLNTYNSNKLEYKEQQEIVNEFIKTKLGFSLETIASYGGEGQGEEWWIVYKVSEPYDIYIKLEGFYSSYNGVSFESWIDNLFEVKPVEKTIIVYE